MSNVNSIINHIVTRIRTGEMTRLDGVKQFLEVAQINNINLQDYMSFVPKDVIEQMNNEAKLVNVWIGRSV